MSNVITVLSHAKFVERREKLQVQNREKFLEFKMIRYSLFRVQTFLEGGSAPEGDHMAVGKEYEDKVAGYGGLVGFAKTWDIDPMTFNIVRRDMSVWAAHDKFMDKVAQDLPIIDQFHQDTDADQERMRNGTKS